MSRPAAEVHREVLTLLPPGWAWPRDPRSLLAALLMPMADEVALIEATAEAMMEEVDPRTAVLCIEDFERVLGPDPCGRDPAGLPLAERQALAHQRWTSRGGQSIPYFVELAAKRGVAIEIEETRLSEADLFAADDELIDDPEQFVWIVKLPLTQLVEFEADASEADDPLYEIRMSDVECDIRRLKPAHTDVVFSYVEEAA